jgi:CBS domain-containing membrane protein
MLKLEDWMTPNPQVAVPEESALEALDRMVDGGFRHLPVVNPRGALIGIVSIDDMRAALPVEVSVTTPLSEHSRALVQCHRVAEMMTYLPVSAGRKTPLARAVHELLERRIGCLPVVDGGGVPIGMFTESDGLRALLHLLARAGLDLAPLPSDRWVDRASALRALADDLSAEQSRIREALARCQGEVRSLAKAQCAAPLDEGDACVPTELGALSGMLAEFAARRLEELTAALDRYQRGELGTCRECRCPIPVPRLRAVPSAELCARCARVADGGDTSDPRADARQASAALR